LQRNGAAGLPTGRGRSFDPQANNSPGEPATGLHLLSTASPEGDCVKILVLGAAGMLGHTVLRYLTATGRHDVVGSVRSSHGLQNLPAELHARILRGVDVENHDSLTALFAQTRPEVVVNCIGLVKQLAQADDPLAALPINALLPHRIARMCSLTGSRFIHVSTDCVFAGTQGAYRESDTPDARDLYGLSKYLGEVDAENAITLRTSIIGHELASAHGLVGWFLAQSGSVRGYTRAIFSGLPTVELARVIDEVVLPRPDLRGLHHVSAAPINKHDLLRLVAQVYGKQIDIVADDRLVIDRSLDSSRLREQTGYQAPDWPELVRRMHAFG
jgi:dTDP-4-dehydrorhamnose reductase